MNAVVYDLDGTLVRLAVDWATAERAVAATLADAGVDAGGDVWSMLDAAEDAGVLERASAVVCEREHRGVPDSERLPAADELPRDGPTAVCSLNCEGAVRAALDRHGLLAHVDAVVGRDTVPARKPDPRALLAALDAIGVEPGAAVFVGDSESDAVTAERAGVAFEHVGDRVA